MASCSRTRWRAKKCSTCKWFGILVGNGMKASSTSLTHTHMEIKYTSTGIRAAASFSRALFHFFTTPPSLLLSSFLMQIIFQFPRWCARDKMAARNDDPMQISGPTFFFFFFLFVLYFFLPNLSRLLNPPHHLPLSKSLFPRHPRFLFRLSLWKMQTHLRPSEALQVFGRACH